jgi:hypothetical protein
VALYTPWLGQHNLVTDSTGRSQRAMEVIESICARVESNLVSQQCFASRNVNDVPPWGLFFAYHVCLVGQGSEGTVVHPETMRDLKYTLVKIDARWNVAGMLKQIHPFVLEHLLTNLGMYLQLLEASTAINKLSYTKK